jgi:hypothetical protein
MRSSTLRAPLLLFFFACGSPSPSDDPDPIVPDAGVAPDAAAAPPDADLPDAGPPVATSECASVFDPAIIPEYHVTISETEEAALMDEFLNREARLAAGLPEHPWHPITLEVVLDGVTEQPVAPVLMRLKGQSSWQQTVDLDENPKMQVVIAFNEVDGDGRFHGLRKIELDMPRNDRTFLKQRLGLSYLREAGAYAQCANSARLYLNGAYYGLYAHLERLDKEFLQRYFPDEDDGDLWENGQEIKTNEEAPAWDRHTALWAATEFAQFDELADADASIYEWAVEAMLGNDDGYYFGTQNFYFYDHPTRGYIWLPHDVDHAFHLTHDMAPVIPLAPPPRVRNESYWHHYLLVMRDAIEIQRYVDALAVARSHYDVDALQARLDDWAAQINQAAAEDPHRPFTMDTHVYWLGRVREVIRTRAEYIDAWLACWTEGGADADGDGLDMCHDCDDEDPAVHPGAIETCDGVDQDCDGNVDRTAGAAVCPAEPG